MESDGSLCFFCVFQSALLITSVRLITSIRLVTIGYFN